MIGTTISHFTILEKLGEGGMGVVYKALDTTLDRTVALKFLPERVNKDETAKARFLQEAKAAAGLNHPNICTIFGVEEFEHQVYMAMEFVEGGTLSEKIPFAKTEDALIIAGQIADALQEAHTRGIVHRDIKADNIMLSSKGQAKVMDFGLAKLKGAMKLTRTSSTVGTLGYMAPEQIQGGEVDHRSDIFSFGVLVFEMLTGKLPFRGEHEAAMVYSIVNEEPQNIAQLLPELSPIVVNLINRCLEKDPAERYQHFDDITADVKRALRKTSKVMRSSPSVPAHSSDKISSTHDSAVTDLTPSGFFRKNSVRVVFAAAALIIIALMGWWLLGSSRPAINPDMSTSVLQIPATEYQYPDMSPDGKWLAFPGADVNGKWDIYMMFIETGESKRLTTDSSKDLGNSATARFSPDGSSIVYGRLNRGSTFSQICVVSVLTGSSRVIADSGIAPVWNPAGDRIFFYRQGRGTRAQSRSGWREYWSVSPQGSDAKIEFIDSLMQGSLNYFTFRVSPDGKKILFTRPMKGEYNEIILRDLTSGKETQLTDDKKIIDEVFWTGNGSILYSSNRSGNFNIWVMPETGGDAVQITRGAGPDYGISYAKSVNRLIFSQRTETSTLWMVKTDGSENRQLYPDENIQNAQIAPDGKTLALEISHTTLSSTIMIRDFTGGRQEILFPFSSSVSHIEPQWSPSGRFLSYLEYIPKDGVDYLRAKVVDISNGHRIQDFGEGIIDSWLSDSLVVIIRNISKDEKNPKYNESHLLNLISGEEKIFFKDSTYAFPILGNALIGYSDSDNNFWIVSRQELAKNAQAKGTMVFGVKEISSLSKSEKFAYYIPNQKAAMWKLDLRTMKKTKIMNLAPGDNIQLILPDRSDNVLTYTKHKRKTSIVKIDNLFEH